jgi:hypothetical protein
MNSRYVGDIAGGGNIPIADSGGYEVRRANQTTKLAFCQISAQNLSLADVNPDLGLERCCSMPLTRNPDRKFERTGCVHLSMR